MRFIINSILLGVGLAMDAFSVSIANGLYDPRMRRSRRLLIAGTFAFFQFLMPMAGWTCVHFLLETFQVFQRMIPWIALGLLSFIGGKMLLESRSAAEEEEVTALSAAALLLLQGIATSIDALSAGFTIAEYDWRMALEASLIIAVVTFVICIIGVHIGRRFGMRLARRATALGGLILILIGLEIAFGGLL